MKTTKQNSKFQGPTSREIPYHSRHEMSAGVCGFKPGHWSLKLGASVVLGIWSLVLISTSAFAQGTAFTYQGRLNDGGSPANGTYDLRFILYSADIGGSQQGPIVTTNGVVTTNGLFTVTLNFGNQFPGADRWLEIGVRTNGAASFVPLNPRQKLTPTPYAITAGNVVSGGLTSGTYSNAVTFDNPANSFSGSGSGLTLLNASSLASGLVPDARLSGNVALLNQNQSFTGTNLFTGIGIGVGTPMAPLQVANLGESGLTDSYPPSVWGDSTVGDGVFGSTSLPGGSGVFGYSSGTNGSGVIGLADATGGVGVYGYDGTGSGQSDYFTPSLWGDSGTGDGIFGSTSAGGGYGVYGLSTGDSGLGVYGSTFATNGAGVWADGASSNSPALTIGIGGLQVAGASLDTPTTAFIHVASAGTIPQGSLWVSYISNPLCDGDPNAILIVTPNANPGGGSTLLDTHAVNVEYFGSPENKWAVVHADGSPIAVNTTYNVLIIKP